MEKYKYCLNCKNFKFAEDIFPEKCLIGNDQVLSDWFKENGKKHIKSPNITELECYEPNDSIKSLDKMNEIV